MQRLPVCESSTMKGIQQICFKIARSNSPVLITGESGVGKELVAKIIHQWSNRSGKVFVPANVSAYAGSILESELFGHVRGAFTGALRERKGLFRQADKGTLFLDEIGDLQPEVQIKLLRVVEDGIIQPVGSDNLIETNVRIVAATNHNLQEKIAQGKFREDFFYRIGTFNVAIPPLRERLEDIIPLAEYFVELEAEKLEIEVPELSSSVKQFLLGNSWPGNIRQLRSVLGCAIAFVEEGSRLELSHLEFFQKRNGSNACLANGGMKNEVMKLETDMIKKALSDSDGKIVSAAKMLKISRRALDYKIAKYKIHV
ncbi:MAG TPA: sigma-54 dependent transcriptional regulator [Patescibacteria group bacterium]|nr:sigma-54 dependent transcriptional regulator [Patescibacteria group bacterium]